MLLGTKSYAGSFLYSGVGITVGKGFDTIAATFLPKPVFSIFFATLSEAVCLFIDTGDTGEASSATAAVDTNKNPQKTSEVNKTFALITLSSFLINLT